LLPSTFFSPVHVKIRFFPVDENLHGSHGACWMNMHLKSQGLVCGFKKTQAKKKSEKWKWNEGFFSFSK